jgi:hypothetical protein
MKQLLTLLLLIPSLLFAGEPPKELSMPTDVGKVVITSNDCSQPNSHGFGYDAYATEHKNGAVVTHKGCWMKRGDIVYIWFYDESPPVVASYKDFYFKPEINI